MKVSVVIPSYKVKKHIIGVIRSIPICVEKIYVVDDCCPDGSGDYVLSENTDKRVVVLKNDENLGVGGAVMHGYKKAIEDNMDIVIKLDGDGQMDPNLIPKFIEPILLGEADYTKGNRFFNLDNISQMPKIRLFGNAVLSLMTKFSSGYWNLFDPTNGYTAIHTDVINSLPLEKISKRYFFESDILFRLNTLRAVVVDIPMDAKYEDEVSNLKISKIIGDFLFKHS
ncbi:glycosyltransferase family 2 protein, partial [Escherichia coli]